MKLTPGCLLTATASQLQQGLAAGAFTSVDLVEASLAQINKHDAYLRVITSKPPRSQLLAIAKRLDDERAAGKSRSGLHGIPILLKDNIATEPSLEMETTAGSLALVGSRPARNAYVAQKLLDAGAIVLAKANMSEFAWYKTENAPSGWSAVGGQTQSAYIRGGFQPEDTVSVDSDPGGSSTGSAVGVSAGYVPIAIGTETNGSLVQPSSRAALFTLKPTVGRISTNGIIPISSLCDAAGPIAKSALDIAIVMDLLDPEANSSTVFQSAARSRTWEGLRIGTLDPEVWLQKEEKRTKETSGRMDYEITSAYSKIKAATSVYHGKVSLAASDRFDVEGGHILSQVFEATFRDELNEYLGDLEKSDVRSLSDVIEFNKKTPKELPPEYPGQEFLENAQKNTTPKAKLEALIEQMRQIGKREGLDKTFADHDINILIGPADSDMSTFAAAAGYPIASLPLGYLNSNGRPFGLCAIAPAGQDHILVQLMAAWEAHFPPRQPPKMLADTNGH